MNIANPNLTMQRDSRFEYNRTSTSQLQMSYGQTQSRSDQLAQQESSTSSAIALDFSFSQSVSIESSSRAVYDYEDNMSHEDQMKKEIMQLILGRMGGESISNDIYPKQKPEGYEPQQNPYMQQIQESMPSGFVYGASQEYYHKQSIEFSASIEINTPNSSFKLDIEISYTQEFYQSYSSTFALGEENFADPFVMNYDEDVNPFEGLDKLRFEFDKDDDGKDDLISILLQDSNFLNNERLEEQKESLADIFKIWQLDENNQGTLLSMIDINFTGIYLGDIQEGVEYQNLIEDVIEEANLEVLDSLDITV